MALIDQLRAILPNGSDLSDEQVISQVSDLTKLHPQDVASELGMTTGRDRSAASAGLRSGYEDIKGLGYSAGGAISDAFGIKSAKNWFDRQAKDKEIASQIESRPDLERIEDQSLGSALPYAAYQLGKQIPQVGAAIGAGLLVPEAAVPAALSRGAAYVPRMLGGGGLGAAETFAAQKAALRTGQTVAKGLVGGAAVNEVNAIGSLYQNANENPEDTHPGLTALGYSVPYAIAETAPEALLMGRLGGHGGFEGNFLKRTAKSAGVQAGTGATSEILQGEMEMAVGKPLTDEEKFSQRLNAGVAGGLVEGILGATGGFKRGTPSGTAMPLMRGTNEQQPTSDLAQGSGQAGGAQPNTGDDVQQAFNDNANIGTTPVANVQGATDVAQQAAAAQQQQNQAAQIQQQQEAAAQAAEAKKLRQNEALQTFGVANSVDDTRGIFVGKPILSKTTLGVVADALEKEHNAMTESQRTIASAIISANNTLATPEKTNPLVSFSFNVADPQKAVASVANAFKAVATVAGKYQIHDATSAEDAAARLDEQSKSAKGVELDKINAIHQALTGKDTSGFIASQQSKGEKNGNKQPTSQVETTAGVGGVPVQGGAAQAATGGNDVGNGNVQPIEPRSNPQEPTGQQTGQLSGEGIRNSASPQPSNGTSNMLIAGNGQGQGAVNEGTQNSLGGQQGGEPQQTSAGRLDNQNVPNGPRQYAEPIAYYATDLAHIPSARRIEIISELLAKVLQPKVNRGNVINAQTRAELLRLSLLEQLSHEEISKLTGLKTDAVEKQLERMGVKLGENGEFEVVDPELAKSIVEQAANFKTAEFPDGIGEKELAALYATRYETTEEPQSLTEELENEEKSGDRSKVLAEELNGKGENQEGKSMGTISSAGGSQGAVESLNAAAFDRIEKLTKELNALPEKDPRRTAIQKKIDAEWATYGKKQAEFAKKDIAATNTKEGEEENAVQEQSTDEGNVRQPAGNSEKVGKGNTKSKKSTKQSSKQETNKKPVEPQEVKSDAELAGEAWDKAASEYPNAPKWSDLLPTEQKTFIEYGSKNWTAEDVQSELVKLAKGTRFNKTPKTVTVVDQDNQTFAFDKRSLPELEKIPGIARALDRYVKNGIAHVLDSVDAWYTTNDAVDWNGVYTQIEGQNAIGFNVNRFTDEEATEWTTHHELGHAVDQLGSGMGGIFSGLPQFNVSVKNNKIIPMGDIIKELHDHYVNNPNSELSKHLVYPFDRKQNSDLDANGVREEVFAQLWAAYNTNVGRDFLEEHLPNVADFMGVVYDEVSETKYGTQKVDEVQNKINKLIAQKARNTESGQLQQGQIAVRLRENRVQQTIDSTIPKLPTRIQKPTRVITESLFGNLISKAGAAKELILRSAITEDVVKYAQKYMRSAEKYLAAQYARQAMVNKFNTKVDKILTAYEKLDKAIQGEGAGSINEYIADATLSGKWGYYPGAKFVGTKLFEIDPDMAKRFDAFKKYEGAQELIKTVFEHGHDVLMAKQEAATQAVNAEFSERERQALYDPEILDQLAVEKKAAIRKISVGDPTVPYAPLSRYGDFVVIAKSAEYQAYEDMLSGESTKANGDETISGDANRARIWMDENQSNSTHYVVQFAETLGEANKIAQDLGATGNYDNVQAGRKETQATYAGGSDIHLAVARLRNLFKRSTENKNTAEAKALDKMIGDLYLLATAENSARKSEVERKKISGFDKNMMRNLATTGKANAHFLASMEHNDSINEAIDEMRQQAKDNRAEAMPYFNELMERNTASMDYKSPSVIAKSLNQVNHIYSLTFSPAFYLQQMVQTAAISLPYMAGRLGYVNAARHINRAYKDISSIKNALSFKNVNDHLDFSKAPADVRAMLDRLVGMGKIDIGMDSEFKAKGYDQTLFDKVMYKMQGITNRIEAVNRSVAAIAAYRGYLERYGNDKIEGATQYAATVVSDTHGSYDGFNTPRVLQSTFGKVALQFRRFQIIQLSMLAKMIHTAFIENSASKEEKLVAKKTLAFICAQMAVVAGGLGVPFASQLAFLVLKMFGSPDEPDDVEYKLRKLIGDPVAAELLLHGVTGAVGWESFGKKISMENVASPFGGYVTPDLTNRKGIEKTALAILGPSLNLSEKLADSFQLLTQGYYYKGLEGALPNGLANVLKAGRYATEGITMRNGDIVMKPDDMGTLAVASQMFGLPTNAIAHQQFAQKVKAEYDQNYQQRLTEIKGDYVKAFRENDSKAMADAREEFMQMEQSRMANGYKRQPLSELLKAPQAAQKREHSAVNGVESTKQNKQFLAQMGA